MFGYFSSGVEGVSGGYNIEAHDGEEDRVRGEEEEDMAFLDV